MTLNLTIANTGYTFTLYPIDTKFNRISGIYLFLIIPLTVEESEAINDQSPTTFYHLLYLGITNNFQKRFTQHHKIEQALKLGMTHIGILKTSSGRKRKSIERKLLQTYNPPLNQTWLYD